MLHRLYRPPPIPLSFNLAVVVPRRNVLRVSLKLNNYLNFNIHRSGHGLPGYLILFAPHAFVPQRQNKPDSRLRKLIVFLIFSNFTSTLKILLSSFILKFKSIKTDSKVKLLDFYFNLKNRLRTLYAQ